MGRQAPVRGAMVGVARDRDTRPHQNQEHTTTGAHREGALWFVAFAENAHLHLLGHH